MRSSRSSRWTSSSKPPETRSPAPTRADGDRPEVSRDHGDRGGRCARRARPGAPGANADVVYSLAYGDQPALICELVEWARACGFDVIAAGKGTKYLPHYRYSTPETVWEHYGIDSAPRPTPVSIRACSTPSSTGPSRRSRWHAWPTRRACSRNLKGFASRRAGRMSWRRSCAPSIGGALSCAGTVEVVFEP